MSIEVHDNLLSSQDFLALNNTLLDHTFPWNFASKVISGVEDNFKNYQLFHNFYNHNEVRSEHYQALMPLFRSMNIYMLVSCKANLNPYAGSTQYEHGMHQDVLDLPAGVKFRTAVFYINGNNGYTKIESENQKIMSVPNRLVTFDSTERHTGATSTNSKSRCVININYIQI